ncbi:hypothetical protein XH93_04640 [Bradyrhizobium sp. CCBAU 51753]|nr:hypothetical protein XH93_04640 [Bradyrhizobium sp. CCBAU 51753]
MADYDLAIIGDGLNGTSVARDAAGRGLRRHHALRRRMAGRARGPVHAVGRGAERANRIVKPRPVEPSAQAWCNRHRTDGPARRCGCDQSACWL